jgi:NAD(P)H-quinone oxidoreductase subunit 5
MLAWSTCAQMGFMLMQCGLGVWELALLHLVAHSLYKAHAFLSAGETVAEARRHALAPAPAPLAASTRAWLRLSAAPLAIALAAASALAWQALLPGASTPWIVLLIVGLGLAPLFWQAEQRGVAGFLRGGFGALLLAQIYFGWHHLFHHLVPTPAVEAAAALALFAGALFALLYGLQAWLLAFPGGALSRRLHPAAYAGFWLDEGFTRLAFRVWPVRLPLATLPTPLKPSTGERA